MLHPECKNIPEPNLLPGQLSHGAVGVKDGKVQWISMAFESVSTWHPSPGDIVIPVTVSFSGGLALHFLHWSLPFAAII